MQVVFRFDFYRYGEDGYQSDAGYDNRSHITSMRNPFRPSTVRGYGCPLADVFCLHDTWRLLSCCTFLLPVFVSLPGGFAWKVYVAFIALFSTFTTPYYLPRNREFFEITVRPNKLRLMCVKSASFVAIGQCPLTCAGLYRLTPFHMQGSCLRKAGPRGTVEYVGNPYLFLWLKNDGCLMTKSLVFYRRSSL